MTLRSRLEKLEDAADVGPPTIVLVVAEHTDVEALKPAELVKRFGAGPVPPDLRWEIIRLIGVPVPAGRFPPRQ